MEYIYHFTYMTTNIINNKIYIGIHSSNKLYDSYIGSGKTLKRAIKKYGKEKFVFTFLRFFDTREEALNAEKEIVNNEFLSFNYTYNLVEGGGDPPRTTKESSKKTSITFKKRNINKGEANPFYGKYGYDHPKSKAVIYKPTGKEYGSLSQACKDLGFNRPTMWHRLKHNTKKNTFNYL